MERTVEQQLTALVVSDAPDKFRTLLARLKRDGYKTITVGEAGLFDAVRDTQPSIIVVAQTPENARLSSVYQQLKNDPHTARLPVLLASTQSSEDNQTDSDQISPLEEADLSGASSFVETASIEDDDTLSAFLRRTEEATPSSVESKKDLSDADTEPTAREMQSREVVINRITRAVRRSLDPLEVFRTAVVELGSHLKVDRCVLHLIDRRAKLVRNVAEYTAPGIAPAGRDYSTESVAELIDAITRQSVVAFDDAAAEPSIRPSYEKVLRLVDVRSVVYATIKTGEEVLGAFALSHLNRKRKWQPSELLLARAVADQTGIAIRQAELYQRAETMLARETLINRLSQSIRASLELPEVIRAATHELGRALNASRVHFRPYDPNRLQSPSSYAYTAPGVAGLDNYSVSYTDALGVRLLRDNRLMIINDSSTYAESAPEVNQMIHEHAAATGARSEIMCPILMQGRFRGTLCIHQTDRLRRWTADEASLVEAVAAQLSTGIAQAEMFEMMTRAKKEWEATFDAMSDGIFIFDNARKLIRVNRAGAALEDSWPHLLLGRRCCDILRESGDETEGCVVERVIAEGRSVTIEVVPERLNRPLLVTVEPVPDGGGAMGSVCTVRDLSELREMEAVAREQQSLLQNVLDSARETIVAIDREGRFQWSNAAIVEATGFQVNELIGRPYLEIIYEDDRPISRSAFANALAGEPQSYEIRFIRRDGAVHYALVDKSPLTIDGRITGVLAISRDITEQKRERELAAQADKLRALGQLASGVAHDFNNVLAAILGRAQLLRRNELIPEVAHGLEIIQTAAEDAAQIVRRIQTFARQSQRDEFERLDLGTLVGDAIEITRTRWENEARTRSINYDVRLSINAPLIINGNASELREVFINLIFNALDAMPDGGKLHIAGEIADDDTMRLSFTDSGTGITDEVRERIFEPFYTTKGAQGTGLGLFVSYGIIERHHGSISAESGVGQGATFTITLPAAAAEVISVEPALPVTDRTLQTYSVLVVDDEEIVRETLADMLEALGHETVRVSGGKPAIEQLDARSFDVVFTDLSMPEMDGWELAREIRRHAPQTFIVLATGYGATAVPPEGCDRLVDEIIGKPFNFDEVEHALDQFAGKTAGCH